MKRVKFGSRDIVVQGRQIRNLFIENESADLAVVFSGFAYSYDMPVLYYLTRVLVEKKYSVLAVDLGYSTNGEFLDSGDEEQENFFGKDLAGIKDHILDTGFDRYLLAGKSLGTTCCLRFLEDGRIGSRTDQVIWITPGTYADDIYGQIPGNGKDNVVVYGTDDPFTKRSHIESIVDKARIIEVEEGDHGLESSSLARSIHLHARVFEELEKMIEEANVRRR